MRVLPRLAVLVGLLTACAAPSFGQTPPPNTGIQGIAEAGPQCPVVVRGQPCPPRPIAATVAVQDPTGAEVTRFTSGSDGRFQVSLPPGTYTLVEVPRSQGAFPTLKPVTVTVVAGQYTSVMLEFDTGIR